VFNLKGLIVLRTEKTAFKKFGTKKLAGTFLLQMQATYFQERVTGHLHLELSISRCGWRGHPHLKMLFYV
jgi:hypothetical protein